MTVEQLLTDALHGADDYAPSPDLFAKVQRSIAESVAHRRRIQQALGWAVLGVVAAAAWLAVFLDVRDGLVTDTWWAVEVLTAAVLMTVVLILGPLIRRFGEHLTLEVFRSNRETSRRFLNLLDIAYYLVFGAYIIMTTSFTTPSDWGGELAALLEWELIRVGGLFLLMGVLHAITIAVLPVMGLIFASNWRRAARTALGADAPEENPQAKTADRVASWIVWGVLALVGIQLLLFVLPGVIGLLLGGD